MKLPGHDAVARQADEHLVTHQVKLPKKVVERPIRQVAKRPATLHHRMRRHHPVSDGARLTNIFVITPLRVLLLIILVGTTLEVLTERSREEWRLNRWSHRFAGPATSVAPLRWMPKSLRSACI